MIFRALVAVFGIGALAVGGAVLEGQEVDRLRHEVEGLQQRVTQLEQRATRLEQARDDEVRRADDARVAIDGLIEATQRLATGDGDVGAALDFAEGALSAQAGWSIRAARTALANKDLGLAGQHLLQAIAEATLQPMPRGVR